MPAPGIPTIRSFPLLVAILLAAILGDFAPAQDYDSSSETVQVPPPTSPTPTPVPTPTPIKILPPFSLSDCSILLTQALDALPRGDEDPTPFNHESVLAVLGTITNYLRMRDEMHSTLVNYTWSPIARGQVSDGLIDNEEFNWEGPDVPRQVSALSFEVQRGDAYLHFLRVIDTDGNEVATFDRLRRNPRLLRHSLPRREVFHLWRPSEIGRIELAYSQANPGRDRAPKVIIHAGQTSQPEYGKSAIYFITRAEQRIRASSISAARTDLLKAQQEIRHYREQLQQQN